ncbi:hypothetical protein CsSME_00034537 [Camellia sinensis var. sinensis]
MSNPKTLTNEFQETNENDNSSLVNFTLSLKALH